MASPFAARTWQYPSKSAERNKDRESLNLESKMQTAPCRVQYSGPKPDKGRKTLEAATALANNRLRDLPCGFSSNSSSVS